MQKKKKQWLGVTAALAVLAGIVILTAVWATREHHGEQPDTTMPSEAVSGTASETVSGGASQGEESSQETTGSLENAGTDRERYELAQKCVEKREYYTAVRIFRELANREYADSKEQAYRLMKQMGSRTVCIAPNGIAYINSSGGLSVTGQVPAEERLDYQGRVKQLISYRHIIGEDDRVYYAGYQWTEGEPEGGSLTDALYYIEKYFKEVIASRRFELMCGGPERYVQCLAVTAEGNVIVDCNNNSGIELSLPDRERSAALSNDLLLTENGNLYRCDALGAGKLELIEEVDFAVAVAGSSEKFFVLHEDGTVTYHAKYNRNYYREGDVSEWKNIIQVISRETYTLGLQSDGRVVIAGNCSKELADTLEGWSDIVELCTGKSSDTVVGKRADGTFVTTDKNIVLP